MISSFPMLRYFFSLIILQQQQKKGKYDMSPRVTQTFPQITILHLGMAT